MVKRKKEKKQLSLEFFTEWKYILEMKVKKKLDIKKLNHQKTYTVRNDKGVL